MASAGADRTIRLWDPGENYNLVGKLKGHFAKINCIAFRDNFQLISGSNDFRIKLWNIMAQSPFPVRINVGGIKHFRFLSSSVVALVENDRIRILDLETNETIAEKKFGKALKFEEPAECLVSPDRQWIGCVFSDFSESNLIVMSADGKTSWVSDPMPYTTVIFFLPESKRFGTVFKESKRKLGVSTWDSVTGEPLETRTIEGDLTLHDNSLREEEFNEFGIGDLFQEPVLYDSIKEPENSFYSRGEYQTQDLWSGRVGDQRLLTTHFKDFPRIWDAESESELFRVIESGTIGKAVEYIYVDEANEFVLYSDPMAIICDYSEPLSAIKLDGYSHFGPSDNKLGFTRDSKIACHSENEYQKEYWSTATGAMIKEKPEPSEIVWNPESPDKRYLFTQDGWLVDRDIQNSSRKKLLESFENLLSQFKEAENSSE